MSASVLGRVGIYLTVAGIVLGVELSCFDGFGYIFSAWGIVGALLVPVGIFLVLTSSVLQLKAGSDGSQRISFTTPGLPKQDGLQLQEVQIVKPNGQCLRLATTLWTGAILILVGHFSYIGGHYWAATRIVYPLDQPIALTAGPIRSKDFYLNLRASYYVELRSDRDWITGEKAPCNFDYVNGTLHTRLTLFKDGRMIRQIEKRDTPYLGEFYARNNGTYGLEIELLSYPDCLNQSHPRLVVEADVTSREVLYGSLCGISMLPMILGLIVMGRSLSANNAQYAEIRHGIYPGSRRPRLPLLPRFSALPSFGALYVAPIVPLAILIWGAHYVTNPIGIWVSLKMPSSESRLEPWAGGLVLRIASENHWYLNSTKVSPHDLKEILARALSRRAERVVYLEADSEVEYQEVITATDAIRAVHAKIVLLTPRAKGEAARRTGTTTRK